MRPVALGRLLAIGQQFFWSPNGVQTGKTRPVASTGVQITSR
jgi:hypothetical protein